MNGLRLSSFGLPFAALLCALALGFSPALARAECSSCHSGQGKCHQTCGSCHKCCPEREEHCMCCKDKCGNPLPMTEGDCITPPVPDQGCWDTSGCCCPHEDYTLCCTQATYSLCARHEDCELLCGCKNKCKSKCGCSKCGGSDCGCKSKCDKCGGSWPSEFCHCHDADGAKEEQHAAMVFTPWTPKPWKSEEAAAPAEQHETQHKHHVEHEEHPVKVEGRG